LNRGKRIKISIWQKTILIVFSLFLTVAILEVGLRIGGFFMLLGQRRGNIAALKEIGVCRIMCLGGSTTANGGEYSYPSQMEEVLNKKEIGINFKVINKGLSGSDSVFIVSNLKSNLDKYKPHIVVTMTGANDDCDTIPYEDSTKMKLYLFLKSFRVYKLAKLINLHIENKINGIISKKKDSNSLENEPIYFIRKTVEGEVGILLEKWSILMDEGRIRETEAVMKAAIELEPNRGEVYLLLLDSYGAQGKINEGDKIVEKIGQLPFNCFNDPWELCQLGFYYQMTKRYTKAEEVLKRAIDINPYYRESYAELATVYREQNCIEKLNNVCEKIINRDIKSGNIYGFLATSYRELGDLEKAQKYYNKTDEFWMKNYKEATKHNYELIKEIVEDRGIQLVAVQYPMRNVEALKRLFDSSEGVIFVSNEHSFKKALEHSSYEDYFFDNFAGDFGHCTPLGNKLLAENIANNILEKCFNK